MRHRVAALTLIALAPALALAPGLQGLAGADDEPLVRTGERAFALVMERNHFNGRTWPDTPLLEAYEDEEMNFVVHTPYGGAMHTFHMHGHPWTAPERSHYGFVDAVRLDGGETHDFNVTAGIGAGNDGDWFYHCHVNSHFQQGMWGLLRVYPYTMDVDGDLDRLEVALADDGEGLEDATFTARLRTGPDQVTAATAGEGEPVDVGVRELGEGRYRVTPDLPADARGELVLVSHHEEGESLARLDLTPTGYELDRDVTPGGDELPGEVAGALPGEVPVGR